MSRTKIEWSDETWPVVTGCTPCSTGCTNCYGARMAATRLRDHPRYKGLAVMRDGKPRWTGKVNLNYNVLEQPLHFRKPRMIFVASMGDWLHSGVSELFAYRILDITQKTPQHIYQFLTKRASRLPVIIKDWMLDRGLREPPSNLWQGVSIENQAAADERIPLLLQTSAAVRFVSVEPYLSEVDLSGLHCGISWCIIGAESGPNARPMDENWVRRLIAQCRQYKIPVFYKQKIVRGKKISLPMLDGRQYAEFPPTIDRQNES